MVLLCIYSSNFFFFCLTTLKKKKKYLIIQSAACLSRDDLCCRPLMAILKVDDVTRASGNASIMEIFSSGNSVGSVLLVSWINICAQMYSPASM